MQSELVELASWLATQGYAFTTATPATHALVNARPGNDVARDLRGVFGWSRAFEPALLPDGPVEALRRAGLLREAPGGLLRSAVRYSTLHGQLFAHSAFPTVEEDAVFFGPDTYRFADLLLQELREQPLPAHGRILDVGCGSGAGGITAALACAVQKPSLVLTDISPRALQFAAANAAHAGCHDVSFACGDLYAPVSGRFDFVVANPPYLNDAGKRLYRDGGGRWGEALSVRIVSEGLPRLAPGGRLVLYTGAAIVDGRDPLLEALQPVLQASGCTWRYRELDPDVFGEELATSAYSDAERIAVVALVCSATG